MDKQSEDVMGIKSSFEPIKINDLVMIKCFWTTVWFNFKNIDIECSTQKVISEQKQERGEGASHSKIKISKWFAEKNNKCFVVALSLHYL